MLGNAMMKIGHFSILVKDYDEAANFYTEKLGFVKLADNAFGPDMRWISVAPKKSNETLIVFVKADTPAKKAAIGKQAPGHVLITIDTDNIERDYKKMKEGGVKFHGAPQAVQWGKEVVFEDLYGNLFDLVERSWQQ